MPYGLRSAPKIFSAVADAVEWITRGKGADVIIDYLDDLLVVGAPVSDECALALRKLLDTFEILGQPVALDKLDGPDTTLTFLVSSWTPGHWKFVCHKEGELIQRWQGKRSCVMKGLESLIRKLAHATLVVPLGRTFLRHMFELKSAVRHVKGWFRLNNGFRLDVLLWATFLESWNGTSIMAEQTRQ